MVKIFGLVALESMMMKIFGLGQMDQNGILIIGMDLNQIMLEADIEIDFSLNCSIFKCLLQWVGFGKFIDSLIP